MNIDFPNITATGTEALEQIKSYLFRLSEQLNYELNNLDRDVTVVQTEQKAIAASVPKEKTTLAQFDALKSLIINSAEIVDSYYEQINKTLKGEYVAKTEYGDFKSDVTAQVTLNGERIDQNYQHFDSIVSDLLEDGKSYVLVNARIRSGYLGTDEQSNPIYGVEIGQTTNVNGTPTFGATARFTANRLSFYNGSSTVPVAYFSDSKLFITEAEITSSLKVGGYRISESSGLAFNWVGQ